MKAFRSKGLTITAFSFSALVLSTGLVGCMGSSSDYNIDRADRKEPQYEEKINGKIYTREITSSGLPLVPNPSSSTTETPTTDTPQRRMNEEIAGAQGGAVRGVPSLVLFIPNS